MIRKNKNYNFLRDEDITPCLKFETNNCFFYEITVY